MSVVLKNINLSEYTIEQQINKVAEEELEFFEAFDTKGELEIIEEFWDTVQAKLGLLSMKGIMASDVMDGYINHLRKLPFRPRVK